MAISWGAFAGHMRVGIDVWTDPINTNTTSVTVYVAIHVQADSTWSFDDPQNVILGGDISGGFGYTNRLGPNQSMHVGTTTIPNQVPVYYGLYGGGPDYQFDALVGNHYQGANPGHSINWPLPPRPANVPTNPGVLIGTVTATTAVIGVYKPDERGSAIIEYENAVSPPGGDFFAGRTSTWFASTAEASGRTVTGLQPNSLYKAASRARNGVGWGAWTWSADFTTSGSVPGVPTSLVSSLVTETTARVAWTAPSSNGGSAITGYDVQLSTTSNFASPFNYSVSSTSINFSSLQPYTIYYVRSRAKNAVGTGSYSSATSFKTKMRITAVKPAGTLVPFQTIQLTGTDPDDGTIASRQWTQVGGSPTVAIAGATGKNATFYVPGTLNGTTLTFRYTVTPSGGTAATADVEVPVQKAAHRAVVGGAEVPMNLRLT